MSLTMTGCRSRLARQRPPPPLAPCHPTPLQLLRSTSTSDPCSSAHYAVTGVSFVFPVPLSRSCDLNLTSPFHYYANCVVIFLQSLPPPPPPPPAFFSFFSFFFPLAADGGFIELLFLLSLGTRMTVSSVSRFGLAVRR